MINRVIGLLLFVGLFAGCSRSKETTQTSVEQPAQAKQIEIPDGKIIENQTEVDTLKGSIKAYAQLQSGPATVTITYHSPAVRGRIIWGGLVPLDQVWVTGAHMATTFESNYDFVMGDKTITAGKYALFTIPAKDKWTIILNTNWQQHLTDEYKIDQDVVRFTITPKELSQHQERLQYVLEARNTTDLAIHIRWEKLEITVPFAIINPEFD